MQETTTTKPLSGLDGTWLHLETPETPMHVGQLCLFDLPHGYLGDFVADIRNLIARRMHLAPVFQSKLAPMPLEFANPAWVHDDAADLDHYVQPPRSGVFARPWHLRSQPLHELQRQYHCQRHQRRAFDANNLEIRMRQHTECKASFVAWAVGVHGSSRSGANLQPASDALAGMKPQRSRPPQTPAEALTRQVPRPMTDPPRSAAATPAPAPDSHWH